jgi:hypothetical protein
MKKGEFTRNNNSDRKEGGGGQGIGSGKRGGKNASAATCSRVGEDFVGFRFGSPASVPRLLWNALKAGATRQTRLFGYGVRLDPNVWEIGD